MEIFIVLIIFSLMVIISGLLYFGKIIARAIRDANNFKPVNRPRTLWVDMKTNTWQTGYVSDRTIWWRVFFNSLKGKPL